MTMFKLMKHEHLKIPKIFGGQKGDFDAGQIAVIVTEDLCETTALASMADGASLEQVNCYRLA